MNPSHIIAKRYIGLLLFVATLLLNSCSLGKEAPLWQSGMFSADGKYYAYTYSVTTITGIQKKGNFSTRQGIIANYLQVINLATGKKILEKPYKSKGMLWLREVEGDYIWLQQLNIANGIATPVLFDLATQNMKFDAKELQKLNPQLFTKSTTTFYKDIATGIVSVEGADGRKYRIDPATGKASATSGNWERVQDKNAYCYQTDNRLKGYSTTIGTRQNIYLGNNNSHEATSVTDFIHPQFLAIEKSGLTDENTATFYGDHFFVISDNTTTDKKDRQLTMLHKNTLKTLWSIAIPQAQQEMNNYNKERFFLKDKQLFLANSTQLLSIDTDKGTIVNNYSLFE